MKQRTLLSLSIITVLGAGFVGAAQADTEREYLMRLTQEIDALAPLIDTAEENADKAARIRFRYDWLRRDLARIREGLLEHATADQAEPRHYPPLRGDYRR
jgi:RAQPRD family integrative conjugative element protein